MRRMVRVVAAVLLPCLAAGGARADEQAAIDGCIDRLRAVGGPDAQAGGQILSHEWAQSGTLVMLRDAGGTVWRCLAYDDGTVGELAITSAADDGGGAMAGAAGVAVVAAGETRTVTVKFARGTNGTSYEGRLAPGAATRYVLGAKANQFLDVWIGDESGQIEYSIRNPDRSALLDLISASKPYTGQLWQSGEHVVEVVNRGTTEAGYRIEFQIN